MCCLEGDVFFMLFRNRWQIMFVYQERKGTSKKQWLLMLFLLLFFVLFLRQWMFGTVRDRN